MHINWIELTNKYLVYFLVTTNKYISNSRNMLHKHTIYRTQPQCGFHGALLGDLSVNGEDWEHGEQNEQNRSEQRNCNGASNMLTEFIIYIAHLSPSNMTVALQSDICHASSGTGGRGYYSQHKLHH